MAVNGDTVLLYVDISATPTLLGSQRGLNIEESADAIDISDKDDEETKLLAGRISGRIRLTHLFVAADTAYLELQAALRAQTLVTVYRYEGGSQIEQISGVVTNISGDFPDNGAAEVTVEIATSGAWS